MKDSESLAIDAFDVYKDIKEGGVTGIGEAIMSVGQFIVDLPPSIEDCPETVQDFEKMGELFTIFGNFSLLTHTVEQNILWHPLAIKKDIKKAIDDFENEKYYEFGVEIGDLMVIVLSQKDETMYNFINTQ